MKKYSAMKMDDFLIFHVSILSNLIPIEQEKVTIHPIIEIGKTIS